MKAGRAVGADKITMRVPSPRERREGAYEVWLYVASSSYFQRAPAASFDTVVVATNNYRRKSTAEFDIELRGRPVVYASLPRLCI